ncbi:MAG TPA: hypothetical protein EYP49_04590 [Anaerolineae bacterium]|nr:hypothetical protein [Anaerolineae bacterium]
MEPIPFLTLKGVYRDAYNAIVRPERKFAVSYYFLRRWGPHLGPAASWLVIALRQRCFWNDKQDWCVVDSATLAREAALSRRVLFEHLGDKGFISWFFRREGRRRYHRQLRRSVQGVNFYTVRSDDPLVPADQAGLAALFRQALFRPDPFEDVEEILTYLLHLEDHLLAEELAGAAEEAPFFVGEGFTAYDVLEEVVLKVEGIGADRQARLGQICSALQSKITRPERVYLGTQYFRLKWVPLLGHALASFIVALRTRCYWNEESGELRDVCRVNLEEIAVEVGCSSRHLRRLRQREYASLFFEAVEAGQGCFRVQMGDPLTPEDQALFEKTTFHFPRASFQVSEQSKLTASPLLEEGRSSTRTSPPEEAEGPRTSASQTSLEEGDGAENSIRQVITEASIHSGRIFGTVEGVPVEILPVDDAELPFGVDASEFGEEVSGFRADILGLKMEVFALGAGFFRLRVGPSGPGFGEDISGHERNFWHSEADISALGSGHFCTQRRTFLHSEADISALRRTFLHSEADISALRGGHFCTAVKVLISTISTRRKLQQQYLEEPGKNFVAAAASLLLDWFGLKEPGRSRLLEVGFNYVDAFAWMLYAATQPGLEGKREGYVYNRLLAGDPPPEDFRFFAQLPAPLWNLFYRAERYGIDVPESLRPAFQRWCEAYGGFFSAEPFSEIPDEQNEQEDGEKTRGRTEREIWLKALAEMEDYMDEALLEDLRQCRVVRQESARKWVIFVKDLFTAHQLGQVEEMIEAVTGYALEIRDFSCGEVIGQEVMALEGLSPLPADFWPTALAELALQMSRATFNSWLKDSKPVGRIQAESGEDEVVIAVRDRRAREWLENRQRSVIEKTLAGLLEQPVSARFVVMFDEGLEI